jgi:hypothetical protein
MKIKKTSWMNFMAAPIIVGSFATSALAVDCDAPTDRDSILRGCVNLAGSVNKLIPIYRSPDDGNWDCGNVKGDIAVQSNGDLKVTWESAMNQGSSLRAYFGNPNAAVPSGDGKCDGQTKPQLNNIDLFEQMDLADKSFSFTINMSDLNNSDSSYYNVYMFLSTPQCCVKDGSDDCIDCMAAGGGPPNDKYYCDGGSGGNQCMEIDIMEANPVSFQSTIHGISLGGDQKWWPDHNGCAEWAGHFDVRPPADTACAAGQKYPNYGPHGTNIDTTLPFTVEVSFPWDHANDRLFGMQMNLTQTGKPGIDMGCIQPKDGSYGINVRPKAGCWSCDQSINWDQLSTAIQGISGTDHDQHMQLILGMNGGYSPVGTNCGSANCATASATFSNFAIAASPAPCSTSSNGDNTVAGDLNNDGCINVTDILMILDIYGSCP